MSDSYYIELDDARDDYNHRISESNWGTRKRLPTSKKSKYVKAKLAKVGERISCANCGKIFIKKCYQQKFCCDVCKNRYHNRRFK